MEDKMIHVVSTGPGDLNCLSYEAVKAIEEATVVVGYKKYIELIRPMLKDQKVHFNGMKKEVERCRKALQLAKEGERVALVSGGDAGIYGMAGIMHELVLEDGDEVAIQSYPGITAAMAAASELGAPIVHDSVYISLSDLLTDIEVIKKRIHAAGIGDFITCIYNPKSKGRPYYIEMAKEILMEYKSPETAVGLVRNARRDNQEIILTDLKSMCDHTIDMSTVIIVGNKDTFIKKGKMITPRGYDKS